MKIKTVKLMMCACVVRGFSQVGLSKMLQTNSLLGSSVHGILQARILEWVAISSSKGSFQPRLQTHVAWSSSLQVDCLLQSHWGSLCNLQWRTLKSPRPWLERQRFKSKRMAVEGKDNKDSPNSIQLLRRIERKESEMLSKDQSLHI